MFKGGWDSKCPLEQCNALHRMGMCLCGHRASAGEEAGSGGGHCRLGSGGRRPGVDAGLQGSETIRMDLP